MYVDNAAWLYSLLNNWLTNCLSVARTVYLYASIETTRGTMVVSQLWAYFEKWSIKPRNETENEGRRGGAREWEGGKQLTSG